MGEKACKDVSCTVISSHFVGKIQSYEITMVYQKVGLNLTTKCAVHPSPGRNCLDLQLH